MCINGTAKKLYYKKQLLERNPKSNYLYFFESSEDDLY